MSKNAAEANKVDPDAEAAFGRWCAEVTTRYALFAIAAQALATLAWWPIDMYVRTSPEYVQAFAGMRVATIALEFVMFLGFWRFDRIKQHARLAATLGLALFLGIVGYHLGLIAGPDKPWYADSLLGLLPIVLVPMSLGPRIAGTLLLAAALAGSYFLLHPEHLENPYAGGQLSFTGFVALVSIVMGALAYRTTRQYFFQSRYLDEARAELARRNEGLTGKVTYQSGALQRMGHQLDSVQDDERHRLASELRERVGEHVAALREAVTDARKELPTDHASGLDRVATLVTETEALIAHMSHELRPPSLRDFELVDGAERLAVWARQHGLTVEVDAQNWDSARALDADRRSVALEVLEEAVSNAVEHSGAQLITIGLRAEGETAVLFVIDDGVGISDEAASTGAGFGIIGMREKTEAADGQLRIRGFENKGTTLTVELPLG